MIVIVGCARLGASFAVRMAGKGHEVTIVDGDASNFSHYLPADFKGRTVVGPEIDPEILRRAGIEDAEAVFCLAREDATNMLVADITRAVFAVAHVVVRIDQPSMHDLYAREGYRVLSPIAQATDALEELMCSS